MDWEYPKVFNAARKGQWDLADALYEEVRGSGIESKLTAVAAELSERGIDYSMDRLSKLRNAAKNFPKGPDRPNWLTTEMAIEAGDKTVLKKAVQMAEEEGVPLTKRYIIRTRQGMTQHVAKTTGLAMRPRPATNGTPRPKPTKADTAARRVQVAHARETATTSAIRHEANVAQLDLLILEARGDARKFLNLLARADTKPADRQAWIESIDVMLEAWGLVQEVLRGARVADEAEEWLKAQA